MGRIRNLPTVSVALFIVFVGMAFAPGVATAEVESTSDVENPHEGDEFLTGASEREFEALCWISDKEENKTARCVLKDGTVIRIEPPGLATTQDGDCPYEYDYEYCKDRCIEGNDWLGRDTYCWFLKPFLDEADDSEVPIPVPDYSEYFNKFPEREVGPILFVGPIVISI